MVTETTNEKKSPWNGTAATGVGLGGAALLLALLQGGGLSGIVGGNRPPLPVPASKDDITYERQLTTKDMEIAKLQAQIYTDDKVDALRRELQSATTAQAVFNATMSGTVATINTQTKQLMGMTGLVINAPAMLSSEAAASAFKANATATSNG